MNSTALQRPVALLLLMLCLCLAAPLSGQCAGDSQLPEGFTCLSDIAPEIAQDIRYYGEYNFVGARVDGYEAPTAIMTTKAAKALKKANASLNEKGYGLKVFDAYRPVRAVKHFVRWAKDTGDTRMKPDFYPREKKQMLFKRGYISSKSGHSRGSTIDLTIIRLDTKEELDMGAPFDFLDEKSHHDSPAITGEQRANRALLKEAMVEAGFAPYSKEWWHYTLKNEPFPKQAFDFPVR